MAEEIVLIIGITAVFLAIVITRFILKAMELRFKYKNGDHDDVDYRHIKQKLDIVVDENEDIKEELREIKYLLGDKKDNDSMSIDLDYEQEQIRIDKNNKFKY